MAWFGIGSEVKVAGEGVSPLLTALAGLPKASELLLQALTLISRWRLKRYLPNLMIKSMQASKPLI